MKINITVTSCYPKDDFYLQWSHIYWWQLKFNLNSIVREIINDLMKNSDLIYEV